MANTKAAKSAKEKSSQQKEHATKTPVGKEPPAAAQPSATAPVVPGASVADGSSTMAPAKPANGLRMPAINDVRLSGRLTDEPVLKAVGKQNVVNFRLASEKRYQDSNMEWQKQVSFVPVALWGVVADRAKTFLHKGAPVYLEGRLRSSSWQTKDGQNRSMLRLEAYKIQSLARSQSQSQGLGQEIGE
jgi:single-strand DNA-binding protein